MSTGLASRVVESSSARRGLVLLIAACCGVTVANIYLAFPLITLIARSFGVAPAEAAGVATLSQVAYAVGLFFVIPLGDVVRRSRLLAILIGGTTLGLATAAVAPNLAVLSLATIVLSSLTVVPHVLIPLVISIVPDGQRGRSLAAINVALSVGIALSRVGGAWLGDATNWHWVYAASAVLTCTVGLITVIVLPKEQPRPSIRYRALIRSTVSLLIVEPKLRWSIALQVPVFATFNLIWSMMILLLTAPPYALPVSVAGLFGLLGLAPLITSGIMGRILDHRGHPVVISAALAVLVAAMVVLQFSMINLAIVIVGIVLMTVGQQAVGVANQSRTLALRADAGSRLNTLYMTSNFVGGSLASGLAILVYSGWGWRGITATALGTSLIALTVWILERLRLRQADRSGIPAS